MSDSDEIVVTGIRPNTIITEDKIVNLAPIWWAQVNHSSGTGNITLLEAPEILTSQDKHFKLAGLSFDLVIPDNIWSRYPAKLKEAINYIVKNWENLPTYKEAFLFLNEKNLAHVDLTIGAGTYPDSVFEISYVSVPGNADRTAVVSGSTATILLNENILSTPNIEHTAVKSWVQMLGHEFWHPKAPDISSVVGSDHPLIEEKVKAIGEEFDRSNRDNLETNTDNGKAVLGSSTDDQIIGTNRNDVLSGMAGNDIISGEAGSNILYGGIGADHLTSGGSADLLAGGMHGDTYTIQMASISTVIREENGFDIIQLNGNISNYQFFQYGTNLEISGNNGSVATSILIEQFFAQGGYSTIERFAFGETEYAASYINYLANGGSNMCYDASGSPIMCSNYGMPIVVDLVGDGIHFIDIENSNIIIDIDGDGFKDKSSWISASDAFIIIDRNNNGAVDGYSEISFVSDMRGAGSDLEGMMGHDTDKDGFITATDNVFSSLKIWQDFNENGISEAGELYDLIQAGISSIDLQILDRKMVDISFSEAQILGRAEALANGSRIDIYDVALAFQSSGNCGCGYIDGSGLGNSLWPLYDGSVWTENALWL